MIRKISIALLVIGGLVVAVGLVLPRDYEVTRSVEVLAPVANVHALAGDLERWDEWSPLGETDPTATVTLGERTSGVGARRSWAGDGMTGELTFTSADPERGIEYDLSFDGGKWKGRGALRYEAAGAATRVTWAMNGTVDMPVLGGYFALLMEPAVGPYFEKGLANLKRQAERG